MATATLAPPQNRNFLQLLASHPAGFWFIFWGELAERCSYYGMMAILPRFISEFLSLGDGAANTWVSFFKAACYFLPLVGGFLADQYLGKYRLIVIFSIPYILGHVVLAGETYTWTIIALALLAMGSGVIKPNISTLMGLTYDQKRPGDEQLRSLAFGMFYMAINIGAFVSYAVLPIVRDKYDYRVAFLLPAVLMAVSFLLFAVGKPFYAVEKIERRKKTPEEKAEIGLTVRRIAPLFLLITFFWAIFDQSHTTWIFFARDFTDLNLLGMPLSTEQVGSINPLLIIVFVPVLAMIWLALDSRGIKARPTDKMMIGFILTAGTMGIMALSGHLAGEFNKYPSIRGSSESSPSIITTPALDPKTAINADPEKGAQVDGVTKLQLVWVPQSITPVTQEGAAGWTISWGDGKADRVEITPSVPLKVEFDAASAVIATSEQPFTVRYAGDPENRIKIIPGEKRVIPASQKVSLWWVAMAFVLLTAAEVLISVTGLELAFVVAPQTAKGTVTAFWLLTVGLANLFINAPVGRLYATMMPGAYFAMLAVMTLGVIIAFFFVARYFNALGEQAKKLAISEEDAERILSDQIPGNRGSDGIQPTSERDDLKGS